MIDIQSVNFEKGGGLIPAIVQHADTGQILMLGFMNGGAIEVTISKKLVTFYSRTKKRLWTKGETSGNHMELVSIQIDCDQDTLLVKARPKGPVCHLGEPTCFAEDVPPPLSFLTQLEGIIDQRREADPDESYVAGLLAKPISKIAQKVGEEGVETALAAVGEDDEGLKNEAADLVFHLQVLLRARGLSLSDVVETLLARHS